MPSVRSVLEIMLNRKRKESVVRGSPVAQNLGVVGTLSISQVQDHLNLIHD